METMFVSKVGLLLGGFRDQSEIDTAKWCFAQGGYTPAGAAQYIRS